MASNSIALNHNLPEFLMLRPGYHNSSVFLSSKPLYDQFLCKGWP